MSVGTLLVVAAALCSLIAVLMPGSATVDLAAEVPLGA